MSRPAALTLSSGPARSYLYPTLLIVGFALAVCLRVAIGGAKVAGSAPAGLAFAVCLVAIGLACKSYPQTSLTRRALGVGLAGALVLCLPSIVASAVHPHAHPAAAGYVSWALVVTLVAVAEEYFLRGVLFDAVTAWRGRSAAVVVGAFAFAVLHVPLYGWHVLPLDLAVGLWLGSLRLVARAWTAPALAHTLADLFAWWLR